ncbi:MAG: hydantoinase/oxoprolinase family protein [Desulfitobacteriaceae bacterium]|nr:hydantoinase/oxoprolinase family protein [Desulfitobacteriaceae bacterium]
MSLVLGIDTGGTYTDGIVVELSTKKILNKAKAITTRENLAIGIRNCINNLDFMDLKKISVVSLSTTLATNAIVEGRGCEVGLIMLGHQPVGKLPVEHYAVLPGGHDIKGRPQEELDLNKTRQAISGFKGKVDAVAISGYLSVRNPEHEVKVGDLVREMLDLPVVYAHQLTTSLGFHERTVTAALNARLIPIIAELIESVKVVLKEKRIDAPIMIVKGDGCLMSESLAREKPIDTILSGPASSIMGGTFLTQNLEALVFDMGGTTTDIAILNSGVPRINKEGATVGGWLTRVEAAEIYTYGLGGDSYLQVTKDRGLLVGPQRVWPISLVAHEHSYLVQELTDYEKDYNLMFAQATDCFMFLKLFSAEQLTEVEEKVIELLQNGPHSLFYLADKLDMDPNLFNLQHLVNLGILARISVTPTDILHAAGKYTAWNNAVARQGVEILSRRMGKTFDEFIEFASESIVNNLCLACLQSLMGCEGEKILLKESYDAMFFINKALNPQIKNKFGCTLQMKMPVIGIGAPVRAWLPKMAEKLNTELVIPEHAEVANAIGAATGKIMETIRVLIKPGEGGGGYIVHAPWTRKAYIELADATAYAIAEAKKQAALAAEKAGAAKFELVVNHEDIYANASMIDNDIYVESRVEVAAVGRPEWEREEEKEKFFVDTIGC